MKKFLLMSCCWLLIVSVYAQQRTVSGSVTDETDGSPLPGVSVIIKGTSKGTVTDGNGVYSIDASTGDVLTFSFIGFEAKDVTLGTESTINVTLGASISTLQEVVVIGFGEREKKDITGSISSVTAKDIETTPFASPQFALQGKTSGVRVVNTSGDPSAGPQIFVRGIGTWNGSSQPLYVIDGQIITPPSNANQDVIGNINLWTLVNPNDIESISVLKDATAAAVYGSRAANGVILITTKKGKKGKPVIEFNSQIGVQNIPTFDVLGPQEYVQLTREIYENSIDPNVSLENNLYGRNEANLGNRLNNYSPQFDPESEYYLGENPTAYNWQDEIRQKNALTQNYNIKLSGANEATDYYISLGATNQESVIKGSDLERYNLGFNVNTRVNNYIRAGLNYKITYQESEQNNPLGDAMRQSAAAPVWQPLYDPNNRFGFAPSRDLDHLDVGAVKLYGAQTRINPLALLQLNFQDFSLLRNLGQGYLEIEPIKGLTIRGSLSADYTYQQRESFTDVRQDEFLTQGGTGASPGSFGIYGLRTNKFFNLQADLTASFNRSFNKHNVSAVFVIQDQSFKNWTEDVSTRNAQTNERERLAVAGGAPGDISGFSGLSQKFWYSYVSRAGYNYDNRYYIDLSYRRDASNGFPKENRWGNFYSVAGAWRISAENFMAGLTFLDDLKLRAGWGQTGNDEAVVGNFAYLSKVTNSGSYSFGSGNGDPIGRYLIASSLRDLPNRNIFWETVTTTNAGFDASLLQGRVTATFEYFNRITSDILQTVNIPLSVGTNNPVQNIGSLKNSGVEFELGYNNRIGALTYGISGNISFIKNKVTDLYNDAPLTVNMNGVDVRVEEGRSIGHLWGYKVGGIFRSQAEIDAFYAATPDETNEGNLALIAPGDLYFVDVYGEPTDTEPFYSRTPDGVIDEYDQTEIGKTIPGHTYGINLTAGFKGLDLTVNFYGEGDVDKVNVIRQNMEAMNTGGLNALTSVRSRYTATNTNTSMPRAVYNDSAANNRFSTRWVEKAGFFRLNTWQIGYSLDNNLLAKTNIISRVRVYVGGQNNMLITNWSGLDPVNDNFPLPKSYFVGINATF